MLRGSYSHHYRRLLPDLLAALEFRCNNTEHRPVMEAIELLRRYKDIDVSDRPHYSRADRVPLEGVVPRDWREARQVDDKGIPYELCVLKALREAIRRREIWVVGAIRWRDLDEDLPADFEDNRDVHYAAIRAPLDGAEFTAAVGRDRPAGRAEHLAVASGVPGLLVLCKGHLVAPGLPRLSDDRFVGARAMPVVVCPGILKLRRSAR